MIIHYVLLSKSIRTLIATKFVWIEFKQCVVKKESLMKCKLLYLEKEVVSNNDKPLLSANDDQKY